MFTAQEMRQDLLTVLEGELSEFTTVIIMKMPVFVVNF